MATTRARVQHATSTSRPADRTVAHVRFVVGEAVLAVLALALSVVVRAHRAPLPLDVGPEQSVQHALLPHHMVTTVIDAVSTVNWPLPSAIIMVVVTLALLLYRRFVAAIASVLVGAAADGSSFLANEIIRRPRPAGHGIHVLRHITNYYSFPSGHVVHAVAYFGFVLFLTFQLWRARPVVWPVRIIILAFILLMGPSRILEGEHWPSDVVAGVLYGAFWLILGIHAYAWAARRWPHRAGPQSV